MYILKLWLFAVSLATVMCGLMPSNAFFGELKNEKGVMLPPKAATIIGSQYVSSNAAEKIKYKLPQDLSDIEVIDQSSSEYVEPGPNRNLFSFITSTKINLCACHSIGMCYPCAIGEDGNVSCDFNHT